MLIKENKIKAIISLDHSQLKKQYYHMTYMGLSAYPSRFEEKSDNLPLRGK